MTSKEALNDLIWHTIPTDISVEHQMKCGETIKRDLELLEILKKLVLGVGTEEDLATVRKHFEMEVKQVLEKCHEGYTIIQYLQENNNDAKRAD